MKKAIKKTYKTKGITGLSVGIAVKGVKKTILFTGGHKVPFFNVGGYSTTDKDIQEALEKSSLFGKDFALESKKEVEITEPEDALKKTFKEPGEAPEEVTGITNAQGAKAWLKENKEATNEDVKNVDAINAYCSKHNVLFPDWEQK